MNVSKITPMIQQYLAAKESYPDAILFFRMGDFFEMFFDDAELASRILEITLTSRNKKDKTPIPMCGVPVRAVKGYISRLISRGFKVAICDQVEDPAAAKGLVRRDVVRVITPGMIVENELLDEKSNNYLLALNQSAPLFGVSYLDISTGTFRVLESPDSNAVFDEILRISPSEILIPEPCRDDPFFAGIIRSLSERAVTFLNQRVFDNGRGHDRLVDLFNTLTLEGFGCEHLKAGLGASGAVIFYVSDTQKQKIEHITKIESYTLDNYLVVDDVSCRNLELIRNIRSETRKGTLLSVIDLTVTAMGARLLKRWLRYPLVQLDQIELRHDAVQEARNSSQLRRDIREHLKSVYDLERLSSKITLGHSNARDLVALKTSLKQLPGIFRLLLQFEADLFSFDRDIGGLHTLGELIENAIREDAPPTINEGGMIKRGYNKDLDELIQISREGKGWLVKLEAKEREASKINSLKVRFNKVFGYYIEVSKTHSENVPAHYIRKQTLVNADRYITDELKSFEAKVLNAEEQRASLEYDIFNDIRAEVIKNNKIIQEVAEFLATVDCLLNLSDVAEQNNYLRPELNTEGIILIEDGRHPVVEKMITGERFVPNTIRMDDKENQVLIITGPNMAGKSTILRQVALLAIMAQMGSFVPAEKATISIIDKIFTRVGALDNLSQGQSTFMVEMEETANILNNASDKSLIILDEIGRGTSTFDGLSIAWAVAEFLHDFQDRGVKTLFATHYHELTELAQTKARVKNYNVAVKEWNDEIIFLRKLVDGGTNRSYGIQVARLAGIPKEVIARAKKILLNIETGEYRINGSPLIAAGSEKSLKGGHQQLNLFGKSEYALIEKLQEMDISKMTPIDAINYLNKLQEKAKNL